MNKPAIFIDAFITNDESKRHFDYNVANFIKQNYDIFIISNKIPSFDKFSDIKYFEYDSKNRVLTDSSKYQLVSKIHWGYQLYDEYGSCFLSGHNKMHGFTNWTVLYNLKKICKVLKGYGYEHMIRCEYDLIFKNYDLMNTIFKDFGKTENSKKCMVIPGDFGCTTNFFLINVDYIDSIIPEMENEEDYLKFIQNLYGKNLSPVFEEVLFGMIKNNCEFLNKETAYEYIENIGACMSTGDSGFRHQTCYKNLFMTPVNDNNEFFMYNASDDNIIYIKYSTENELGNRVDSIHELTPRNFLKFKCSKYVEIKTSQMKMSESRIFDLSLPCNFTIVRN